MNDIVKVKVLKGFLNGTAHVDAPDEIEVTTLRARELARNGLVELPEGINPIDKERADMNLSGRTDTPSEAGEKKQQEPKNKKASDPKNKAD